MHGSFRGQCGGKAAGTKPSVYVEFEAHRRATPLFERAGVPARVYHYPSGFRGATCRLTDKAAPQCGFLLPPGLCDEYSIGSFMSWSQSRIYLDVFKMGEFYFGFGFGDTTSRVC